MDNSIAERPVTRIGFIMVDGFALMSYAAAVEPLRAANLLAGSPIYRVEHIASGRDVVNSSSGAHVAVTQLSDVKPGLDVAMVVAGGDPFLVDDPALFGWLRRLARTGVQLGGVSGGPVVLARAGLMSKRRMTVHWEHAEGLSEIDPDLLIERSLYVIDRDRMTCAGGTAPIDMMHALIASQHGEAFARQVSDWFIHTEIRPSEGPQRAGFIQRYGSTNPGVILAIETMENNIAEPLTLSGLSLRTGVSARQLNRLFAATFGQGTMAFYRDLRLAKARNLLDNSVLSITEVALAVGFGSAAHFSQAFKTWSGRPPSEVRSRR